VSGSILYTTDPQYNLKVARSGVGTGLEASDRLDAPPNSKSKWTT